MHLDRPTRIASACGLVGGVANSLLVYALLTRYEYDAVVPDAVGPAVLIGPFVLGFVPLALSVYTRLIAPGVGLIGLASAVGRLEVTTPEPELVGELGGHRILDGSFHALSYARSWHVWLSLLVVAGIAEFAVRGGYGLGDARLQRLPRFPLPRSTDIILVSIGSGLVGTATVGLLVQSTDWGGLGAALGGGFTALATAVALGALLQWGLLAPLLLYAWYVPIALRAEVFSSPDSGVHFIVVGGLGVVSVAVAALEFLLRSALLGWDGGRFSGDGGSDTTTAGGQ